AGGARRTACAGGMRAGPAGTRRCPLVAAPVPPGPGQGSPPAKTISQLLYLRSWIVASRNYLEAEPDSGTEVATMLDAGSTQVRSGAGAPHLEIIRRTNLGTGIALVVPYPLAIS